MNPDAPSNSGSGGNSQSIISVIGSSHNRQPSDQKQEASKQPSTTGQQGYGDQYSSGDYQGNYQYSSSLYEGLYGNQQLDQKGSYYDGGYESQVGHNTSRSTAQVHPYTDNLHGHSYDRNSGYSEHQQHAAPTADAYSNYRQSTNQFGQPVAPQSVDSVYSSQANPPPTSTASYGHHIPTQVHDSLYNQGSQQELNQEQFVERVPSPSVDPLYNSDPLPEPSSTYTPPSDNTSSQYTALSRQPPVSSSYQQQSQDPVYTSQTSQYPKTTSASLYSHQAEPATDSTYSRYGQNPPTMSSAQYADKHKSATSETSSAYSQANNLNSATSSSATELANSDMLLQLANKAMHSIQKASVKPETRKAEAEPRVSEKVMEVRRVHFKVVRFMFEAASKLKMQTVTLATACRVYHKVFKNCSHLHYDPYLIATTSLYLGGKIEEDHMKLRDVINVCYSTLHPERQPLDIGSTYWSLRETTVQCELFIMRMLQFRVAFTHPHKYLLHYTKSVLDLLPPGITAKVPLATTAWALLRDSYHGDLCLHYDPEYIAVATLYLALQLYGVEVPFTHDGECTWWEALVEDLKLEDIRKISREMLDLYSLEVTAMV